MTKLSAIPVAAIFALLVATTASAAATNPGPVNAGSPAAPFSQNKQNEPALAVEAVGVLVGPLLFVDVAGAEADELGEDLVGGDDAVALGDDLGDGLAFGRLGAAGPGPGQKAVGRKQ